MPELLLTLPPDLHRELAFSSRVPRWLVRLRAGGLFLGSDPKGARLGSGGGTVHVLWRAWQDSRCMRSLEDWLRDEQRLVLHSGGESRRLPSYAALGKAFMPMPHLEALRPSIFDQTLADFQVPLYRETLVEAGSRASVLIASGDVWLSYDPSNMPEVKGDIVGMGMRVRADVAKDFGVFFAGNSLAGRERSIAEFLQKPDPATIQALSRKSEFFVDTGLWLLSADALEVIFKRCGWDESIQKFNTPNGLPSALDLYTEVGAALGTKGQVDERLKSAGIDRLSKSVIELTDARFYHVGSTRQLLESMEQLQWKSLNPRRNYAVACAGSPAGSTEGSTWEEGTIGAGPVLHRSSVVTGLPNSHRITSMAPGRCVDVTPVGKSAYVLRPYHIDDKFRGSGAAANICGLPADQWLAAHGFEPSNSDVFQLKIYPVLRADELSDELIEWFFSSSPHIRRDQILNRASFLSAEELPEKINFDRYFDQRRAGSEIALRCRFERLISSGDTTVFDQDFSEVAGFLENCPNLKKWIVGQAKLIEAAATRPEHQARFIILLSQLSNRSARKVRPELGFDRLRKALVSAQNIRPAKPKLALKEDQIVWARSPARIDLAGGWTDTPPYCLEHGGAVLNVAVNLNGQPPIQVFIRAISDKLIRLRSIDQGSEETIDSFEALADFRHPRGSFSLPKAALSLAGFLPEFFQGKAAKTLKAHLTAFGAGLEITLLSAIPKGSGLGTSSIIGAALLAALNRAGGLNWDNIDLYARVLAMEQLLTTGGGWQDQAGAIFAGAKLIQTDSGPQQSPTVRYVTAAPLDLPHSDNPFLLYYTGATRVAKGILQEIVQDMFLNNAQTLHILERIRANAWRAHTALQMASTEELHRVIARSWRLNQQLDPGTRTAETDQIFKTCGDLLTAGKLLGAGGGGFMLLCASNASAAREIRVRLEMNPPNPRARFVDLTVSKAGLEVTVS